MADAKRRFTDDVPVEVEARLRELCLGLPNAHEQRAGRPSRPSADLALRSAPEGITQLV